MMHSYAGIGSRDISPEEATSITKIANIMHEKGYVLYSGHADGSDYTFECGFDILPRLKSWDSKRGSQIISKDFK